MVKLKALALAFLLWATHSYGLYGHITRDTTWQDTVLVTGDVVVDSGVCLTIEPGTVVKFRPDSSEWDHPLGIPKAADLIVNMGRIIAIGTRKDSIKFTTSDPQQWLPVWGCIKLHETQNDSFQYVCISYSRGLFCESSSVLLKNGRIGHCGLSGEYPERYSAGIIASGEKSQLSIVNCIIKAKGFFYLGYTQYGILCNGIKSLFLSGSLIQSEGGPPILFIGGDGIGIECRNVEKILIQGNIIGECIGATGASGIGIYSEFCGTVIINSNIIHSCEGGFPAMDIGNDGIGVWLESCNMSVVTRNRIYDCIGTRDLYPGRGIGILCGGDNGLISIGGSPENQNDIFNNNDYNIVNHTPNDIIATHNWWGTTNRDSIDALIFDRRDDNQYGYVIYEPWAGNPLGVKEEQKEIRSPVVLQIHPNPCYRTAEIRFEIGQSTPVDLKIYDATGRLVKDFADIQNLKPKTYKIVWEGEDDSGRRLPAGIYFCTLETQDIRITEKLILLR